MSRSTHQKGGSSPFVRNAGRLRKAVGRRHYWWERYMRNMYQLNEMRRASDGAAIIEGLNDYEDAREAAQREWEEQIQLEFELELEYELVRKVDLHPNVKVPSMFLKGLELIDLGLTPTYEDYWDDDDWYYYNNECA